MIKEEIRNIPEFTTTDQRLVRVLVRLGFRIIGSKPVFNSPFNEMYFYSFEDSPRIRELEIIYKRGELNTVLPYAK